jgi:hypothetical protein
MLQVCLKPKEMFRCQCHKGVISDKFPLHNHLNSLTSDLEVSVVA